MKLPDCIKTTLRIQPAVILFCSVSILAKVASGYLPKYDAKMGVATYAKTILLNWQLLGVVALMFLALALYAFIWQKLIKGARIAVIYANKSSGVLWSQLAALLIFGEHLAWNNLLGIFVIFSGILLANSAAKERG